MRTPANLETVRRLMLELGDRARGPGRVYLTGGASALLEGWRASTVDVDLKLDPEPAGVFEAIAYIKDALDVNVELAAPDDFLPAVPGWRERSTFIERRGEVEFFHYDFRGQALSKLARAHTRDIADVQQMLARGLVSKDDLWEAFIAIEPELIRRPALDAPAFRKRVQRLLGDRLD